MCYHDFARAVEAEGGGGGSELHPSGFSRITKTVMQSNVHFNV